jgi:hypothetical protein
MRCADLWSELTSWMRHHSLVIGMTSLFTICLLVGCGRSSPTTTGSQADGDNTSVAESEKPKEKSESEAAKSSVPNRKMVGDIPLDVFFDDPISIAKQTGEISSASPGQAVATAPPAPAAGTPKAPVEPMPPAEKAAAKPEAAADGWNAIVSAEDLQDEVKRIRLRLQDNLSSVTRYNSNYKEKIVWDGAGLAALTQIALVHPDKVSWKASAAQIRDAAKEMIGKSKALGPKAFEATKKEFEKIDALLSGNPPHGLPDAAEGVAFSDVAPRKHLMQCIQEGYESLRANYQAASSLEKKSEEAAHTASIVAAYSKVIGTDGYNSADEDDYKSFLKLLVDANLNMAKAAREKDFDAFSKSNGPIPKICSDCHLVYKGNGGE